jgi:hypothetical protein
MMGEEGERKEEGGMRPRREREHSKQGLLEIDDRRIGRMESVKG